MADNLTGLIWLKNADCIVHAVSGLEAEDWYFALNASNNLADGQCGLTDNSSPGDWRLPNVRELHSLVHYGERWGLPPAHPFEVGVNKMACWSSTMTEGPTDLDEYRWVVKLKFHAWHVIITEDASNPQPCIWPVRSGN